jgi:hypothetical protein
MKKRLIITIALIVTALVLVSAFAAIERSTIAIKKPFYVGVTYCGSSVAEAEQLIDRVANYTNLFVLQSGPMMDQFNASEQILDYAVNSGLNVIFYYSTNSFGDNLACDSLRSLLSVAPSRWGSHFLGLYFNDEPGGHMLDGSINFNQYIDSNSSTQSVSVDRTGIVSFGEKSGSDSNPVFTEITIFPSGEINLFPTPIFGSFRSNSDDQQDQNTTATSPTSSIDDPYNCTNYYPNGTITYLAYGALETFTYEPNGTVFNQNGQQITDAGNISRFTPYQQVLDLNPLRSYTDAANLYVRSLNSILSHNINQTSVNLFTSDYGLYQWDYQAGYNTVFAELFGGQTDAQTLALIRGAADMQDKSWGVMINPASQSPPCLQTGNQIYSELQQTYMDGADYAVLFNYAPNSNSTAGLLQNEQFNALEKFWTDIVQNPKVPNNVKGKDALVLPSGYGWGMRSPTDTIWGIWPADNQSRQVGNAVQSALASSGSKLDIVFDEPAVGQYQHVYYWNGTV